MTDEKGDVFFVGKDVATTLGYSDSRKAIRVHVDEEDKGVDEMATPGGKQKVILINESGLYSLVLSSKLPQAKAFKRWVTSEVLPQIRKTGGYIPTRDEKGKELSPEEVLARAHQIVGRTLRLLNGPNCDCLTATQVAESWGMDVHSRLPDSDTGCRVVGHGCALIQLASSAHGDSVQTRRRLASDSRAGRPGTGRDAPFPVLLADG